MRVATAAAPEIEIEIRSHGSPVSPDALAVWAEILLDLVEAEGGGE
jgi:hypothetical protein